MLEASALLSSSGVLSGKVGVCPRTCTAAQKHLMRTTKRNFFFFLKKTTTQKPKQIDFFFNVIIDLEMEKKPHPS